MTFDLARAIERNQYWSRRLGWTQYYDRISGLFSTDPTTAAEFAYAVAQWQHSHRPPLEPDGIIGPRTWETMRFDLGLGPAYSPRTQPGEDETAEVHTLYIRGHTVSFYDYIGEPGTQAKIGRLREIFERMPDAHLQRVYPIFLVRRHRHQQEDGHGGGATLRPVDAANWGPAHSRNTQIPEEIIQRVIIRRSLGMITIPRHRWRRGFNDVGGPGFVVPHEIGHNIDFELHLVPSNRDEVNFPGVASTKQYCGHGNPLNRQVAEAYRKWICGSGQLFHSLPPGMSAAQANGAIMTTLRASPAFRHVPAGWGPQY